jgi:malonyl-CoA/methylmalonyl-CoA synthetase
MGHFLNELRTTFDRQAARPAILHRDVTYTYAHLERRARNCAAWLGSLGVGRGDRVLLCTSEKLPFLAAHLGAMLAGAVSLPVNPKFTREELRYFLADSGARVAIVGDEQRAIIEPLKPALPDLVAVAPAADAWTAPQASFRDVDIGPDDACLMLYSSGTTGRPKGILHTPANLSSSLHALRECWRFSPDDVLVNLLPLFHIHGLSFASQLSLLAGSCMLIEDTFHPRRSIEAIGRGTVFFGIPAFYHALLERPEFRAAAATFRHVRLFTCGSAPMSPETLGELESLLERPVINRYGMTESHVITSLPLDGPWPRGSVGLPLTGIELRVVDDKQNDVRGDEVGTVLLRGPNLFHSYWNREDATREAFATGWFDTGDLGRRDEQGFLTLVGRKNDLIITNGFNVYPQVVERVIAECPGVKECAVLGLPDRRRGERVAAAIVRGEATLDEPTVREFLKDRLVDYQRPAVIAFVDALPRNAMGKLVRHQLAQQLQT